MFLTMSLASREGDHSPTETDAVLIRASIGAILTLVSSLQMAIGRRSSFPMLFIS
jgi:hypothetical protein